MHSQREHNQHLLNYMCLRRNVRQGDNKAGVDDYHATDLFSFIFMSCTQRTRPSMVYKSPGVQFAAVNRYISKLQIILQPGVKEDIPSWQT